jgi:uncharacterized protein
MSGSNPTRPSVAPPPPAPAPGPGGDPSMEDILASIRRILAEDEVVPAPAAAPAPANEDRNVLVLDNSMMVKAPTSGPPEPIPSAPELVAPEPEPVPLAAASAGDLVAPEAAEAAAQSVGSLLRTLAGERTMPVRSGGPTVEDIVRDAVRALIKEWLDANLPSLVERLVRVEIERVVGRAV